MQTNRIAMLGVAAAIAVFGFIAYTKMRLVPEKGLMIPALTAEQQIARRDAFRKWQIALWSGDTMLRSCKNKSPMHDQLTNLQPLIEAWDTRHYYYTIRLRDGHMPHVTALKQFKAMVAANRKEVTSGIQKRLQREGGCRSTFAQELGRLTALSLDPRRMLQYGPEYQPAPSDAFEKTYRVLLHLLTVRVVHQQCNGQYPLDAAQQAQIEALLTRYYNDAFAKLIQAMPLDGDFVRKHFRDMIGDGTTLVLASIPEMVARNGCQETPLQQSYDFVKTLIIPAKK